jgi:transposase InsO family protein
VIVVSLVEACLQLGIKLVHNPGRSPWTRGSIERWFGALNTDMVHALEGDDLFACVGTRRLSIRACGVCERSMDCGCYYIAGLWRSIRGNIAEGVCKGCQ